VSPEALDQAGRHRRYVPDDRPGRRLFVAVPIPSQASQAVEALVAGVRAEADPGVRDVRWVRMDGLHITLRFLGPTLDEQIAGVVEAIDAAAARTTPFEVVVRGAGAFPSAARPRALWLGVDDGAAELSGLAAAIDDGLAAHGWPRSERPFRAHLTLARADGVRAGPRVASRLQAAAAGFGERFKATSVALFETRSGEGPARYEEVHEASFGAVVATRKRE
jgi:2'-5' RNA ligase